MSEGGGDSGGGGEGGGDNPLEKHPWVYAAICLGCMLLAIKSCNEEMDKSSQSSPDSIDRSVSNATPLDSAS